MKARKGLVVVRQKAETEILRRKVKENELCMQMS